MDVIAEIYQLLSSGLRQFSAQLSSSRLWFDLPRAEARVAQLFAGLERWLQSANSALGNDAKPRIELYALCWNEERLLPYFFRHYDSIVQRYVIYDNNSTDRSARLLRWHPRVTLRSYDVEGDSFVDHARQVYDQIWKESRGRADWVIVCNIDEHFYHPDLLSYIDKCKADGVTIIPGVGFEMVSRRFPRNTGVIYEEVTRGCRSKIRDKIALFDPNQIDEINFGPGRHNVSPVGRAVYPEDSEVKCLHFKYLGLDYLQARYAELSTGLRSRDKKNRWGHQYFWARSEIQQEFEQTYEASEEILKGVTHA